MLMSLCSNVSEQLRATVNVHTSAADSEGLYSSHT